jgi:hypothetical protein
MSQPNKDDESNSNLFTFSTPPSLPNNLLKFGLQITMYVSVFLIEIKIMTKLVLKYM